MNPNIVVRLAGGLGNQLFQFAAAYRLSRKQSMQRSSICIDTRFLQSYEAKHQFEIGLVTEIFPGIQIGKPGPMFASIASRLRLARILDRQVGSFELVASVDHLNKINFSSNVKHVLLDGYFQHPDVIFSDEQRCQISESLKKSRQSLISSVKDDGLAIGVHIRRGDYLSSKEASRVFLTIPMEYYYSALQQLSADRKVLVFSDDHNISADFAREVRGVDVRQLNLSLQDEFCLLMACDDHVIANSTFSWWAAYLGYKPSGRVIAPKRWYRDLRRSQTNSLLMPYFELIDV